MGKGLKKHSTANRALTFHF